MEADSQCPSSATKAVAAHRLSECKLIPLQMLNTSMFGSVFTAKLQHGPDSEQVDAKLRDPYVVVKISDLYLMQRRRSLSGAPAFDNPFREAAFLRHLHHPHVLRLVEERIDLSAGKHLLITEYASKGDLMDFLLRNQPVSEGLARHFFTQMLSGVAYLHHQGIAHLDISPENLFLDDSFNIKIADFGAAFLLSKQCKNKCKGISKQSKRCCQHDSEQHQILHGISLNGKTNFMSPERLCGLTFCPRSADVFSMGVVLFILLFGSFPFESATDSDHRWRLIESGQLRALLTRLGVNDVSEEAVVLLEGMLAPEDHRMTLCEVRSQAWLLSQSN